MSVSIFISLPAACSVQRPYLPMYGVWFSSTHTALLNRVESKAFHLINSFPLPDCLDSLSHQRNVASLSIFYCYFHVDCSFEIANWMSPPSRGLAAQDFLFLIHLSNARVNQYLHSFIPYTGKLWDFLPYLQMIQPQQHIQRELSVGGRIWMSVQEEELESEAANH